MASGVYSHTHIHTYLGGIKVITRNQVHTGHIVIVILSLVYIVIYVHIVMYVNFWDIWYKEFLYHGSSSTLYL